jgi:TusA-related sulfurtransferase
MLASQAIRDINQGIVEILVDSGTARDNVSRLGKKSGLSVAVEDQAEGNYRIVLKK